MRTTDVSSDAGKQKAPVDSDSRAALKTDPTTDFLYKARFTLDSRLSRPMTAWAGSIMEKFSRALLQTAGQDSTIVDNQILICFDLFLGKYNTKRLYEVNQSNKRPLYAISQKNDG